jgi:3-phytase
MRHRLTCVGLSIVLSVVVPGIGIAAAQAIVSPSLTLAAPGINDQDDMTFWLHPSDLSQSTIIASDKSADKVFVYDLNGNTLQVVAAQQPGNIDTRYRFPLGGGFVDIVAFNERDTNKIRVYKVNPASRLLEQIDDGNIDTGPNYGFSLYKSPKTGRFYAFTGPQSTTQVKQFELVDRGNGLVSGVGPLRQLQQLRQSEGMVADDEVGNLFVAEENGGIWRFNAEPDGASSGTKIASVGQNGLTADVEGVTIYYTRNGEGYLIASSQGSNTFKVYQRKAPHALAGTFAVSGVTATDGVDVINLPLNTNFAQGIFALHNGRTSPHPVEIVKWQDIATALSLTIDTQYWDPRIGASNNIPPVAVDDTISTAQDTAVTIEILANDSDPNGDTLTVASVTQPHNGSVAINADNTVTYTPNPDFTGQDSFTYTVSDGRGGQSTATVAATVGSGAAPAAPTNLQAAGAKRKANLQWTQSSGANITQNNIYRSRISGGPYDLPITISAAISYSDRGLTPGVTYYYRVTAINSSGVESAKSSETSAVVK